jgi:hypothetical protein
VRGGEADQLDVVTFKTLGAPRGARLRGRRPKRTEAGPLDPNPVAITRVTVIPALGFDDEGAATSWLDRCRGDEDEREQATESAIQVANRAVHAHRLSAADPFAQEVTRAQAHTVRLGYGTGDELVEGYWHAAYTLPPVRRRRGRRQMLAPQEQLASILSGRRPAYPSEDLVLRARLDIDQGRLAQAALQLRAALTALQAELGSQGAADRHSLQERERRVQAIAGAALRNGLDEAEAEGLQDALAETERTIRRRRHREDG